MEDEGAVNEDPDSREMKKRKEAGFSAVKVYDLDNSFDSLIVERKMLLKMHP